MSQKLWITVSLIVDAILVNIGIIGAFLSRFGGRLPAFNFEAYSQLAIAITVVQIGIFFIFDLYNLERTRAGWDVLNSVVKAVTLGTLLITFLTFFYRFFSFPRLVLFLSLVFNIALIAGWRVIGIRIFNIKWPEKRVLIVGTDESGLEILKEFEARREYGYKVIGFVSRHLEKDQVVGGKPILGNIDDITEVVEKNSISQVIITTAIRYRQVVEDLSKNIDRYVRIDIIPGLYEILAGQVDYTLISDIPLVELTREPVSTWVITAKRFYDIALAVAGLILTSPLLLIAAVAIKFDSPGPVIYKQDRVGQHEGLFKIYKLRTMRTDAEQHTGPVLATENDSRITKVGKYLRAARLDEVPQFLNILKGDMSFVGPRPERPSFVEDFKKQIPYYSERFKVKPGMTGLAQVSGFYATTARNKLKFDLIYVHHQSILMDLKIMFQTVKVVLTGRGAR